MGHDGCGDASAPGDAVGRWLLVGRNGDALGMGSLEDPEIAPRWELHVLEA